MATNREQIIGQLGRRPELLFKALKGGYSLDFVDECTLIYQRRTAAAGSTGAPSQTAEQTTDGAVGLSAAAQL
jgi:hypothetical protein